MTPHRRPADDLRLAARLDDVPGYLTRVRGGREPDDDSSPSSPAATRRPCDTARSSGLAQRVVITTHQRGRILGRQDHADDALDVRRRGSSTAAAMLGSEKRMPAATRKSLAQRGFEPAACCWVISISGDMPMTA